MHPHYNKLVEALGSFEAMMSLLPVRLLIILNPCQLAIMLS